MPVDPPRNTPPKNPANGSKAPQRQRTRGDDVRALVQTRCRTGVEQLLAKREDFDRFARVFLNVVEANADLMRCTDGSIARAFMHSAEVFLQVGSVYPHAYLIPYWNKNLEVRADNGAITKGGFEAQFQISVWGYVELFRRSGLVRKVWADVVFENDPFECISGTDGKIIKHNPQWFTPRAQRGKVLGSYACALLENGETVFEPVSFEELDLARRQNRGSTPAWDLWPEQQYQKVAIRRLAKYLPKGKVVDRAFEIDDDTDSTPIDVPGYEVTNDTTAASAPAPSDAANGPLDDVVRQAQATQQAQQHAGAAPAGELKIDRGKLFSQLCDLDERWKAERMRVDAWDEMYALQAAAYCNAVLRDTGGIVPDLPPHMAIFTAAGDASGGVIS